MTQVYAGDDLVIQVSVKDDAGDPKPVTGGTFEASAISGSGVTIAGTATPTDAAAGEIEISFAEDLLTVGYWRVQLRVTLGAITQTVYEGQFSVKPSAF